MTISPIAIDAGRSGGKAKGRKGRTGMRASRERRKFDRFLVPHLYTAIRVGPAAGEDLPWEGHAYDLSEGGAQFELDCVIEPGSPVQMLLELPAGSGRSVEPIRAWANVVWVEDADEPPPALMAAVFTRFGSEAERLRLRERLRSGRYVLRAA